MASEAAAEFARIFREELSSQMEYSIDEAEGRHGTMVPGKEGFPTRVQRLAAVLPFAAEWAWGFRRFAEHVRPDAYLLRVDWSGGEALAVTSYCRFPFEPRDDAFSDAIARARPMRWSGPSPRAVGEVLGVAGPRGVAFRVDRAGAVRTALYYRVEADRSRLDPETCRELVRACGLDVDLADLILDDVRSLFPPGPVGVIGIDDGQDGVAGALKLDPANVPLRAASAFLADKGAPSKATGRVLRLAEILRARWLSYLGAKYGPGGFAGWRAYFSHEPARLAPAGSFRIASGRRATPTLRLPHY